jgi:segregation and condensation protein B
MAEHLKPIIEALIFASPEPLPEKMLLKLLEGEPKEDVEAALALLKQDYERPGGLQLVEVAGGYQIVTRPELHEYVRRLFHERTSQKLSVQALETLAVIAYKQPITAPEITEIRGSNASGVLNTLIGRKLIKIVGRKAVVGRPFMYATTRDFLDKFGLNDISDLPKVEDLADVLGFDPPSLDSEPTATPLAFDFDESSEGGSMESAATDETTAEESTVEESTVEESTADEASAEEPTAEEASAGETVVEEASVEETNVEEATVEEGDDADRENLVRDGEPSN